MKLSFKFSKFPSQINPSDSRDIEAKLDDELHDSSHDVQVEFKTIPWIR